MSVSTAKLGLTTLLLGIRQPYLTESPLSYVALSEQLARSHEFRKPFFKDLEFIFVLREDEAGRFRRAT